MQIRSRAALAAALVGATLSGLALSACAPGGASSSAEDDSKTIHIVGFAVPEAANKAIAAECNKTPEGEGVDVQDLLRCLGRPEPRRRRRARGRLRPLLGRRATSPAWSTRASSPTTGTTARTRASCRARSWCSRVRDGNPKNIQDLGRPDQAGRRDRHPQPGVVRAPRAGTRSPPTARSSATAAPRRRPTEYLDKFFDNVVVAARQRPRRHHRLPRRHRRRADGLRERGHPRPPERRGVRLRHPRHHDPHREPGRDPRGRHPKPSQDWLDFVLSDEGQKQFALKGFRPVIDGVDYGGRSRVPATRPTRSPTSETLLTVDDDFESWDELSTKFFDEENGIDHRGHRRCRPSRSSDLTPPRDRN